MSNKFHKNMTTSDGIHTMIAFTYANASARTGDTSLVSADDGKIAHQTDDDSYYILVDYSVPTWKQIDAGVDAKVAVDSGANPDYLGANNNDGALRVDSTLDYTDGGDYVTIGIDSTLKSNYDNAYSHISSNGSSHSYIDQDVTIGSSPNFTADNFSDGGGNAIITTTQETNFEAAYTHVSSNGTDHTYIDQDLQTSASPYFAGIGVGASPSGYDLHIFGDGSFQYGGLDIRIGADIGASTLTNDTNKRSIITFPHYRSDTEEDNCCIYYDHPSWTFSTVNYGGGNANYNCVNRHVFWTTTGGNTLQGSITLDINKGIVEVTNEFRANESGTDSDSYIKGLTDDNLFYADASADMIGIGTNTPGYKLDVNGDINIASGSTLKINGSDVVNQDVTNGSSPVLDATNFTNVTDADAIHDNISSEISAITEKGSPVSADLIIIEDSADSNNKKRVQIGNLPSGSGESNTASNAGSGSSLFYQKSGVDLEFNGIKSENSRITVAVDATSHDVELTYNDYPTYRFYADQLLSPTQSEWPTSVPAVLVPDSNNNAILARRFDDTTEEGVGLIFQVPTGATNLVIGIVSRAETAPGGSVNVIPEIQYREMPDNSAVEAFSAGTDLTAIAFTTNENWQYDSQSISLSSMSITAGNQVQMELVRDTANGSDTLSGDWTVMEIRISFT